MNARPAPDPAATAIPAAAPFALVQRVRPDEAGMRSALVALASSLAARDLCPDAARDLQLVVAEVLSNVIEHGLLPGPDQRIVVAVREAPACLCAEIRDRGRPLPPTLLSPGAPPPVDGPLDAMPEGGFGWFIIHSLVADMIYERQGGENILSFTIPTD